MLLYGMVQFEERDTLLFTFERLLQRLLEMVVMIQAYNRTLSLLESSPAFLPKLVHHHPW